MTDNNYRIVYVECGKHKFNLSDPGVKSIGMAENGIFVVEHNDGSRHSMFPQETLLVKEEKVNIVVPELVLAE